MTKADSTQPGSNCWHRGGQAKCLGVNAVMADFLKSQPPKPAMPDQPK